MKLLRLAFAVGITVALVSAALGQPSQRQGRQRGGGFIQSMIDAAEAPPDPTVLVYRKDVQHDLKMDLGQRNKFDNLHDEQQSEYQAVQMQNRRNPTAVADEIARLKEQTRSKIDSLLTSQQKDRLAQVVLQLRGNSILFDTEYQKKLGLTDEQRAQVMGAKARQDQQIAELQAGGFRRTDQQEIAVQLQQIASDTNSALGEILTESQKSQLKKLQGPVFKPDQS